MNYLNHRFALSFNMYLNVFENDYIVYVTLNSFGGIDESTGNESFLAVTANYPVPVGIFTIQNCHELAPLHADIVLIAGDECV